MKHILKSLLVVTLLAGAVMAEDFAFTITRAEIVCRPSAAGPTATRLEIAIDKTSEIDRVIVCDKGDNECDKNKAALQTWITNTFRSNGNYLLMQIGDGTPANLSNYTTRDQGLQLFNTASFDVSNYDLAKEYALFAKDISSEDSFSPFTVKVVKSPTCQGAPAEIPPVESKEEEKEETPAFKDYFGKPAEGGIPHLKTDFSMQGSKRQQVLYSIGVNFRPYTRSRLGWGGHHEITPVFLETEYRINASAADKKNVLNIGVMEVQWTKVFRDDGDEHSSFFTKHSPGIVFTVTPKLETEWGFRERNLLLGPRAALPINIYQSRRSTIRLDPFVGFEYGFVWASQASKPGRQLARPLIGSGLTATFFRNQDKPLFGVQIDYIRRFLLKPEFSYGLDPTTGDLVPDRESRRPRDNVKARFSINATEFFAPFIEYEYGRVPPKFNLINSSFKTGIAFNVDMVWKSFN